MSVALRRAELADAGLVAALVSHPDTAPFLAVVRAASEADVAAEIERAHAEPDAYGVHVIEAGGHPVGTVA